MLCRAWMFQAFTIRRIGSGWRVAFIPDDRPFGYGRHHYSFDQLAHRRPPCCSYSIIRDLEKYDLS
jgi:hypothetical protein